MLGVFHRKPWHPSPAVREEIRQLDKRIEQYEFLMNRDTRTLAQLRDLRAQTEAEVRKLNAERNRLYKTNPESDQIPLFTQRLRELRKTIKLCKRIEEHSLEMPMHRNKIDMPRTKRLTRRAFALYAALVLVCCAATPVLAEGDPLTVVNNLSTFIFSIIRAIGLILLGWGIVQVGLSLQSHDPSQRSQGFLTLAGGIIITFAKEILDLIVGTGV